MIANKQISVAASSVEEHADTPSKRVQNAQTHQQRERLVENPPNHHHAMIRVLTNCDIGPSQQRIISVIINDN